MDFTALEDSTSRCLTNYYRDGDDCIGIVHFLFRSYMYVVDKTACKV